MTMLLLLLQEEEMGGKGAGGRHLLEERCAVKRTEPPQLDQLRWGWCPHCCSLHLLQSGDTEADRPHQRRSAAVRRKAAEEEEEPEIVPQWCGMPLLLPVRWEAGGGIHP